MSLFHPCEQKLEDLSAHLGFPSAGRKKTRITVTEPGNLIAPADVHCKQAEHPSVLATARLTNFLSQYVLRFLS